MGHYALFVLFGLLIGVAASFSGLGGGFLMVPLLLYMGFTHQKAVGTSFLAILVISVSALLAHNKLANVDYKIGVLLGIGGIIGAQLGPHLTQIISTSNFKKVFAVILVGLAAYMFAKS
ncbi:MAG TPA: sulfite exporter TauE/SafE family protein [bacterium]|nr:sulfite exporter TauE/SafE family protein [bacterium]